MTNRKYTNRSYPDALEKKILVFDGAMGTGLQAQNLTAEQAIGCRWYLAAFSSRYFVLAFLTDSALSVLLSNGRVLPQQTNSATCFFANSF